MKIRVCEAAGQEYAGRVSHTGPGRGVMNQAENCCRMSVSDQASDAASPGGWLANQPYLLLSIAPLCWAGNAIVGRLAAGHIPPVTLSFLRWSLALLVILPMALETSQTRLADDPGLARRDDLPLRHRDRGL